MTKKNLVIVESPAKAKTIEKYLGSDFKVLSSVGHIRSIAKKVKGGGEPIEVKNGFKTTYEIDPEKKKVFNVEDIQIGVAKSKEIEEPLKEGRVDYFNEPKGFGFIIQNNGEKIFFHVNQVTGQVREGDLVNYTVERGPKGLNAMGVSKKP